MAVNEPINQQEEQDNQTKPGCLECGSSGSIILWVGDSGDDASYIVCKNCGSREWLV